MEVIAKEGISWHVSKVWDGGRELEAALKTWNNSGRFCPTCIQEKVYERTFSVQMKIRVLRQKIYPCSILKCNRY